MTTMITELEFKFLENAVTNDFTGGEDGNVDHQIWIDCWDCGKHGAFCDRRQVSGLFSSLSQKGLIVTNGSYKFRGREEGTYWITKKGWDTLVLETQIKRITFDD